MHKTSFHLDEIPIAWRRKDHQQRLHLSRLTPSQCVESTLACSKLMSDSFSYTISKHAILGLTHSTSLDGRKYNINCTQLDIGNATTELSAHSSKGTFQADGSNKVEPMMDVENVGKTLVFLAKLPLGADVLRMNIVYVYFTMQEGFELMYQGCWYAFHRSRLIHLEDAYNNSIIYELCDLDLAHASSSMTEPLSTMINDKDQHKSPNDPRTNQA